MKKPVLAVILCFFSCFCAYSQINQHAQDNKTFAFSYGAEMNMYSKKGLAFGASLGADFNLPLRFAAGVNLSISANGQGSNILEPSAMLRYYFFNLSDQHSGIYVQADLGASFFFEETRTAALFLGGVRAGCRFVFGNIFYAEPYIKAGYPFLAGAGVTFGYRY